MCPACIASAAVMAAGAGSTGGILAVCIGKFRKFFRANGLSLFQKIKEKSNGNKQGEHGAPERASRNEHTTDRVAAGMGGCAPAAPREGEGLDPLAAERRRMPWLAVEKKYEFDGPKGKASLLDLFDGRRQLIVYRAFFEPGVFGWPEHACRGCSFGADQVAHLAHLNARDTTLAFVSRAPKADIERLKARMGWKMPWYTIRDSFDTDFGVDEWHGTNVFFRNGERVFRTYFINNRGDEAMGSTWSYLDTTVLGRQEEWEDSPEGYPQTPAYKWWNWHDEYAADASLDPRWIKVVENAKVTLNLDD
jgi:predicted dithiol-disulfide oxidoreductase (DUF899 family)